MGKTFFVEKQPEAEALDSNSPAPSVASESSTEKQAPEVTVAAEATPAVEAKPVSIEERSVSVPEAQESPKAPEAAALVDEVNTENETKPIMNEQRNIIPRETWDKAETLAELNELICNCHNCQLGDTRKNFVFGTGNPDADLVVIGEAPGADEDEQGAPFVGRAGQLLTKILESVNFSRDEVFICNIIKCRPPANRRPLVPEVDACEPYLKKQIELIKPKFILALGLTAVDTLLKKKHAMASTRGQLMDYHGIQMLVTYHPAALLRNPEWKRSVWEDVKYLRKLYDEYQASKKS